MPVILLATVAASVGIGVFAAYAAVIGIPRLVLVPTQNHASGD